MTIFGNLCQILCNRGQLSKYFLNSMTITSSKPFEFIVIYYIDNSCVLKEMRYQMCWQTNFVPKSKECPAYVILMLRNALYWGRNHIKRRILEERKFCKCSKCPAGSGRQGMHGCGLQGWQASDDDSERTTALASAGCCWLALVWLAGAQGTDPAPPQQRPTSICTNMDTRPPVWLIVIVQR